MLNMLTIALGGVAAERPTLRVAPSRATHAIYDWLEERERDVYPAMEGYSGAQQVTRDRMTAPTTPARLPEALRGEQYAFVTLPVAEVQAGGGVTEDNVGVGKMINVKSDLDPGAMLPGVAILTRRADALAMSLGVDGARVRACRFDASGNWFSTWPSTSPSSSRVWTTASASRRRASRRRKRGWTASTSSWSQLPDDDAG